MHHPQEIPVAITTMVSKVQVVIVVINPVAVVEEVIEVHIEEVASAQETILAEVEDNLTITMPSPLVQVTIIARTIVRTNFMLNSNKFKPNRSNRS